MPPPAPTWGSGGSSSGGGEFNFGSGGGSCQVGGFLLLLDLLIRVLVSSPSHLPKLSWPKKERALGEEGQQGGGMAAVNLGALAVVEAAGPGQGRGAMAMARGRERERRWCHG
jgi:hypothetical protein